MTDNAEAVTRVMHLGISAIGKLLAYSELKIDGSELSVDTLAALGLLLAELGEVAAVAQCIAIACRRHTFVKCLAPSEDLIGIDIVCPCNARNGCSRNQRLQNHRSLEFDRMLPICATL